MMRYKDIEVGEPPIRECPGCDRPLLEPYELETGYCYTHIQEADEQELQERKHPDDSTKH